MADTDAPTPEQIRRWRGDRTRAAFAVLVGVTPTTIYRWELPSDHAEARTPRKRLWQRLRAAAGTTATTATVRPIVSDEPLAADAIDLLPLLHALLDARWDEVADGVVGGRPSGGRNSTGARALLQVAAALLRLLSRNDAPGAAAVLLPVLDDLDAGSLPADVAPWVHAAAALLFATPHGRLFDPGRATAHAGHVEHLAASSPELQALAISARAAVAWHILDYPLLGLATARADDRSDVGAAVPRCLLREALALAALAEARYDDARERLTVLAVDADEAGVGLVAARCLAVLARIEIDRLHDSRSTRDLLDRHGDVVTRHRLDTGVHDVLAGAMRARADHRDGDYDRMMATLAAAEPLARQIDWPPVDLAEVWAMAIARSVLDDVDTRLEWLAGYRTGPLQQLIEPALSCVRAMARFYRGDADADADADADRAGALALYRETLAQTDALRGRHWAEGSALGNVFVMHVIGGETAQAREVLPRLRRYMDRHPEVVRANGTRSIEAMLCLLEGRAAEAERLSAAVGAMFEVNGNRLMSARCEYTTAAAAWVLGRAGTDERLTRAHTALLELGFSPPERLQPDRLAMLRDTHPAGPHETPIAELPASALSVPVERLVQQRGGNVHGELVAVAESLYSRCHARVDGPAPDVAPPFGGARTADPDEADGVVRLAGPSGETDDDICVEYGHGDARYTLRVRPGPDDRESVLQVLARVASLVPGAPPKPPPMPGPSDSSASLHLPQLPGVVAASASMRLLIAQIERLAVSQSSVIIQGESGTGKEVLARAVHDLSARAAGPYVAFNCAAVPRELFESQLFGYLKGAYTGATRDHPGVIRAAAGGTLFLDEIGELPLDVQAKLLRFLETREVMPLGATRPERVDVRIVTATHRDLEQLVRDGAFRADLFWRLQVVPLHIPPLRERPEDVYALARHFISAYSPGDGRPPILSPEALNRLRSHAWPGNVRELRNVIERALAFSPVPAVLTPEHLMIGR